MRTSPSGERIALTLGDPAGIGPEVTLRALSLLPRNFRRNIILLGPASFYSELARRLKINLEFIQIPVEPSSELPLTLSLNKVGTKGSLVISCYFENNFPKKIIYGRSIFHQTVAAVRSIELAVKLAMVHAIDAIVTPPINKAGLKKAGFRIPGHTEYLAKLSKTKRFEMMLVGGRLRVVLVTRHTPIREVPKKITRKRVEEAIVLTDQELRKRFGIKRPRLVVCGLNPHAGEEGTIGREEIETIIPAVQSARRKCKALIVGPLSPDALFYDAYHGCYDVAICMYHDQGLIPLKMVSRGSGVNVTLGLPFIRTSPDHGTAYDIAERFTADSGSMTEAIKLAFKLSARKSSNA